MQHFMVPRAGRVEPSRAFLPSKKRQRASGRRKCFRGIFRAESLRQSTDDKEPGTH